MDQSNLGRDHEPPLSLGTSTSIFACAHQTKSMHAACVCLRPRRSGPQHANVDENDQQVYKAESNNVTTSGPLQPKVRAVSPADVRRTASGRIVKPRSSDTLQSARDDAGCMRVVGGSQLSQSSRHAAEHSSLQNDAAEHRQDVQQQDSKSTSKRILQPCNRMPLNVKQPKSPLRRLWTFKRNPSSNSEPSTPAVASTPSKSILEASVRRVERHTQGAKMSNAASRPAAVQAFSDAYLLALANGDEQWAIAADIAALFASDVSLKTHDKQTFYGRTAVLRRLNSGVGTLAKMLSNGKTASSMPKPVIMGPDRVDDTTWVMTYTFKQGVMKYGIRSQFSFIDDKISRLDNARV